MEIWEVFSQKGPQDPFTHAGSVLAPDREMAIVYAKECFFRRLEGKGLWVVRREDVVRLEDGTLLEQITDKSYRYPEAYRGVVEKREKAHSKFALGSRKVQTAIAGDEF